LVVLTISVVALAAANWRPLWIRESLQNDLSFARTLDRAMAEVSAMRLTEELSDEEVSLLIEKVEALYAQMQEVP
jgi:hypothetical protein